MTNSIGATNSIANMPFMRNVTKTPPNLSGREAEVLDALREKVSARFGVPVKINHGTTTQSGKTVAFTGFVGGHFNGAAQAEFLLLTPNMLREMAQSAQGFNKWTAWIEESYQRQKEQGMVFPNQGQSDEDIERRLQQIKANMTPILDFWNENRDEEQSWTQLGQGQAVKQKFTQC